MEYRVNVDNEKQMMLVIDKDKLEWIYGGIMRSGSDKVPMLFVMRELGLVDDEYYPTWR